MKINMGKIKQKDKNVNVGKEKKKDKTATLALSSCTYLVLLYHSSIKKKRSLLNVYYTGTDSVIQLERTMLLKLKGMLY